LVAQSGRPCQVEHGPSAGEYALKTLPSITSETDDFGSMLAVGICPGPPAASKRP
jgi:hypothetical protein